jgi:uncharacterized membrane protein HdeD (DUF308 family)
MPVILAKNWWSLSIRGGAAIALGLLAIIWHGITLNQLAIIFGCYAIIDGLIGLAGALRAAEEHERWVVLLIEGAVGITAGVLVFLGPSITGFWLMHVIAGWAFVTGVLELFAALKLRQYIAGEWMLALSGVASLILGLLMVALPLVGILPVALWVGVYALIFGLLLIGLGFRLRTRTRMALSAERVPSV